MVKLATPEQAQEKKATRAAFGVTLAELAAAGKKVVAVDADLTGSTTTKKFAEACPENAKRLFNVGIAEQNMIDVGRWPFPYGKHCLHGFVRSIRNRSCLRSDPQYRMLLQPQC